MYAKESRRRTFVGMLLSPLIVAAIGAGVGYGYAYFVDINPLIYIGFLAALAVGFVIGFAGIIATGLFGASDRLTRFLAATFGVAVCLWVYYCQWLNIQNVAPWSVAPIERWYEFGLVEPFKFAFDEIAPFVNYSVSRAGRSGNDLGSGGAMWFCLIEIALIAGPAMLMSLLAEGDFVNEATGGRMKPLDRSIFGSGLSKEDFQAAEGQFQQREFSIFQKMTGEDVARIMSTKNAKKRDKVAATKLEFFKDSKDADTYSIEATPGAYVYDKKEGWKESFDGDAALRHLLITQNEYDELVNRLML